MTRIAMRFGVLLSLTLLTACAPDDRSDPPAAALAAFAGTPYQPFYGDDGQPVDAVHGRWRTRGYGYRFDIEVTQATLICETATFAYPVEAPQDEDAALLFFAPGPDPGTLLLASHPAEPPFVLERVPEDEPERKTPDAARFDDMFELFAETMREHYAFFALWKVDWEDRVATARTELPRVTNDAELYELFESMLSGMNDGHLGLQADLPEGPRGLIENRGPTKTRIRALHAERGGAATLGAFFNEWHDAYERGIDETLLAGTGRTTARGVIRYGRLGGDVAYVHVGGMELPGEGHLYERLAEWNAALDEVIEAAAGARGLALDLTYNRGGRDAFTMPFVGRFAETRALAYEKLPVAPGDVRFPVFIEPSARVRFRGPVVVLTSDLTISSGETFALALGTLPNVTLMGRPTRGAFSNMLEKPLPNGFLLSLSNERYVDGNGVCYEGIGVPPDVPITIFDPVDPWRGHVDAVRAAAAQIRKASGR